MTIIRSIFLRCLTSSAVVLMIFCCLFFVTGFAAEITAARERYGLSEVLLFTTLTLGDDISGILPIIGLFVFLMVFGGLAHGSEIIALQATGFSFRHLSAIAVVTVMSTFILLLCATELLAPWGLNNAEKVKAQALNQRLIGSHNLWIKSEHGFVFAERLNSLEWLDGVRVYEVDAKHRPVTLITAREARYKGDGEWTLGTASAVRFSYLPETGSVQIHRRKEARMTIHNLIDNRMVRFVNVLPDQLFIWQLFRQMRFLKSNGMEDRKYALAFWGRAVTPVSTLGLILLLFPMFLGSVRHLSAGTRALIGVSIGIPYYIASQASQQLSIAYQWDPALTATAIPLLILLAGIVNYGRKSGIARPGAHA